MQVSTQYADGDLVICLTGELDHHTAAQALADTRAALERYLPRSCALDLSGLSFMDSSGIAYILRLRKLLRSTGRPFWLLQPGEQPGRVIRAAGLHRLVPLKMPQSEVKK